MKQFIVDKRMNKKLKRLVELLIIPAIIAIIVVLQSDNIETQWKILQNNAVYIKFHEESLYASDTGNYARIDVYNNLPKALTYLKGNVTFICNGMNKTIVTDTFYEEKNNTFLAGKTSTLLISKDPLLGYIIPRSGKTCDAAYYAVAQYKDNDNGTSSLVNYARYFFSTDAKNIIVENYENEPPEVNTLCAPCNVTVTITAKNIVKPFISKESYKFAIVEFYENLYFEKLIPAVGGTSVYTSAGHLPTFEPCLYLDSCSEKMCELLKNKYNISIINCKGGTDLGRATQQFFSTSNLTPVDTSQCIPPEQCVRGPIS